MKGASPAPRPCACTFWRRFPNSLRVAHLCRRQSLVVTRLPLHGPAWRPRRICSPRVKEASLAPTSPTQAPSANPRPLGFRVLPPGFLPTAFTDASVGLDPPDAEPLAPSLVCRSAVSRSLGSLCRGLGPQDFIISRLPVCALKHVPLPPPPGSGNHRRLKIDPPHDPVPPLLGVCLPEENADRISERYLHPRVHCNTIPGSRGV